uniref:Uncharacterized protein n=1 Tax=Anguilla anguilla TaxID=7936 RepID=A0A0E9RRM8_ANGAN
MHRAPFPFFKLRCFWLVWGMHRPPYFLYNSVRSTGKNRQTKWLWCQLLYIGSIYRSP